MNTNFDLPNNILFSCEKQRKYAGEQVVANHSLSFVLSGKLELRFVKEKVEASTGRILLIRKNELVKSSKIPEESGLPFKSINIALTQEVLRNYAIQNKIEKQEKYFGPPILDLSNNKFVKAYMESLLPYIDESGKFSPQLAQIKTVEAIELLLASSSIIKQLLFDLSEPHKIDLEKFMSLNFLFNVSISEFARLTGRSLSTFKRDFKTIFNETPEKWLRYRRLDEAKYLISEKGLKPSQVYYSVGFENFSHFSDAFKQRFGFNASRIAKSLL